jgi:hypothetical protein
MQPQDFDSVLQDIRIWTRWQVCCTLFRSNPFTPSCCETVGDYPHLTETSEVLFQERSDLQVPCLRDVRNSVKAHENLGGLLFSRLVGNHQIDRTLLLDIIRLYQIQRGG